MDAPPCSASSVIDESSLDSNRLSAAEDDILPSSRDFAESENNRLRGDNGESLVPSDGEVQCSNNLSSFAVADTNGDNDVFCARATNDDDDDDDDERDQAEVADDYEHDVLSSVITNHFNNVGLANRLVVTTSGESCSGSVFDDDDGGSGAAVSALTGGVTTLGPDAGYLGELYSGTYCLYKCCVLCNLLSTYKYVVYSGIFC